MLELRGRGSTTFPRRYSAQDCCQASTVVEGPEAEAGVLELADIEGDSVAVSDVDGPLSVRGR